MVTVTYAHHSLIQGNRSGALLGLLATVLLAVVFTGLNNIYKLFFHGRLPSSSRSIINYYSSPLIPLEVAELGRVRSTLKPKAYTNFSLLRSSNGGEIKRLYSTTTAVYGINVKQPPQLSPYWVTGFADAESSFSIKVSKKSSLKSGWNVVPDFKIEIHSRDIIILRKLHSFFGIGIVYERQDRNMSYYTVQSLRDIINVIIPHFDKYPLITQKKADYLLFKQAVNLLNLKARSDIEGIRQIIGIKASINLGLSDKLKLEFPTVIPVARPVVSFESGIRNPNWLAGFVDGEGHFYVKTAISKAYSTGTMVAMVFSISQHVRDEVLLTNFIDYLGCGKIEKASTRPDEVKFVVYKFSDILEKIIPFFQSYPLQGIKYMDYLDYVKIANIVLDKSHLTLEGLKKIKSLKSGMNRGRI